MTDEIIAIVDENNKVVGAEPRSKMRKLNLKHRATYILVFNSAGKLFVQKRTQTKDVYPGYYDVVTGGVVLADEEYDLSAKRELAEELGIENIPLQSLFDFFYEAPGNHVWGRVFTCSFDGEVVLQEEEVESGEFVSIDEIFRRSKSEPFTPDGMYVLRRYLDELTPDNRDS